MEEVEKQLENNGQNFVQITINDDPVEIHRGSRTVTEIKQKGKIPLADQLEQVIQGKLETLADDGKVVIKGGEEFISHVRSGGAS